MIASIGVRWALTLGSALAAPEDESAVTMRSTVVVSGPATASASRPAREDFDSSHGLEGHLDVIDARGCDPTASKQVRLRAIVVSHQSDRRTGRCHEVSTVKAGP